MSKGTAWVTGASRGIGRGIALALAEAGYDIAGSATRADPGQRDTGIYEVAGRVEALGRRFVPVIGDVSDLDTHPIMVAEVVDAFGRIDVFVNNAGVAPVERLDILETTPDNYDRVMAVNLRGGFFLSQAVARQMVQQVQEGEPAGSSIIFITSISANAASPSRAEYCISKAGLSMAAQNFAVRLADLGINVYEVRPGIIATDMTEGVREKYDTLIEGGLLLQRRWGTPEDIGNACVALAAGHFGYATGAVIEVGGGFGVKRL